VFYNFLDKSVKVFKDFKSVLKKFLKRLLVKTLLQNLTNSTIVIQRELFDKDIITKSNLSQVLFYSKKLQAKNK